MKYRQYGFVDGRKVVYFHGAPGAPEESAIFDQYAKENGLAFICFDRFSIDSAVNGEAYYELLANEVLKIASGEEIDLVGFSIGGFIALQTSRYLVGKIHSIHLISAAAPLEAGNYIDKMAGKNVFMLAKNYPAMFTLLSYWQKLLALYYPNALFNMLFASARGADKALATQPEFRFSTTQVLVSCFTTNLQGYIRDIKSYVKPWSNSISEVTAKVYVWHGSEDNWSPIAMAKYFKFATPNFTQIEILEDLSHYSCLYHVAKKVCEITGKA